MTAILIKPGADDVRELTLLAPSELEDWLAQQPAETRRWVTDSDFAAKPHSVCCIPDAGTGRLQHAIAGRGDGNLWDFAHLPEALPAGTWRIVNPGPDPDAAALGWLLGTYAFTRYKKNARCFASLECPDGVVCDDVQIVADSIFLVRNLINLPSNDLGPAELESAARELAARFGAGISSIVGDALLEQNYPAIHAVGRASSRAPRLIDLRWGNRGPKITLVGKGVCFDSGGLDLKSPAGMRLMKKDMGGAAHVLGLGSAIMGLGLDVQLRILVSAVENSVSGNAFRPLDVINTRKGLTVEVGNTDAEGRLVLADALTEASSESPDLVVDYATLTGAARIAVGRDIAALFSNNDTFATSVQAIGDRIADPVWRMPLHRPYRALLDSTVADLNNVAAHPHGGAIVAALFMQEFVDPDVPWMHFDVMAWNMSQRPGRPEGGDAQALRATLELIRNMASG